MNKNITPNTTVDESTKTVVESTTQKEESSYLHDKRYEEPFENDGAYADDDID